ncbi:ribonuclease P protein component [Candidatus Kaiserbacteria bacterium]|nr:ribonuclease P protein component [Candidatus Kaiserbacteria bacterium]
MKRNSRLTRVDFPAARVRVRFHGAFFSLSASPLSRERQTSFTCVVSKRVAQNATQRNLIKRRCREAVRARLRTFTAETPPALVFRAKKEAAGASFSMIKRDVDTLVDKIS